MKYEARRTFGISAAAFAFGAVMGSAAGVGVADWHAARKLAEIQAVHNREIDAIKAESANREQVIFQQVAVIGNLRATLAASQDAADNNARNYGQAVRSTVAERSNATRMAIELGECQNLANRVQRSPAAASSSDLATIAANLLRMLAK